MPNTYGASPGEWDHLSLLAGLTEDLLPVVSNPNAAISPRSSLKSIGKVPSTYNGQRQVVGFQDWTAKRATSAEIARWAVDPDLGICVQARRWRAIDVDIPDAAAARAVEERIGRQLGLVLPARRRLDTGKFLLVLELAGEMPKRTIKTAHGIIEFLATGQQFVAVGTHPSGARYEWPAGLPDSAPVLWLHEFEALWTVLEREFGVEPAAVGQLTTSKAQKVDRAIHADAIAQALLDAGQVVRTERDGRLHIVCPFADEHSDESSDSATTYWPAHTGGYELGHFHCLHAHCAHRTDQDFREALGIRDDLDDFDVVVDAATGEIVKDAKPLRFKLERAGAFSRLKPVAWAVKQLLPYAELGAVYGESGSGKSFFVLDLVLCLVSGREWRGRKVDPGPVLYICAEGAGGFRARLRALAQYFGVDLDALPLIILGDAPNLLKPLDTADLIAAARATGLAFRTIVVDTLAQTMPGANENSAEDVGAVLGQCKRLHRALGAMVLLVAHTGKDAAKGVRGWSGIKAALDVEIFLERAGEQRLATVTKMKDGRGEGDEHAFELVSVTVGHDGDGEEITSCVVVPRAAVPRSQRKAEPKGNVEKLVLAQATVLLELPGDVQVASLVDATVDQLVPSEGKRDRRRFVVLRAIEALVAANRLSVAGGLVNVL